MKKKAERKKGSREEPGDFASAKPVNSDKKIWLFLSKIKATVTENIIKHYITSQTGANANEVEVKFCEVKKPNDQHKSFMIGVKPDLRELVYGEKFWPAGITFQRFDFALGRNFLAKNTDR